MLDPKTTDVGNSYENIELRKFIEKNGSIDPLTK
jgi:hypothetical protein